MSQTWTTISENKSAGPTWLSSSIQTFWVC